MADQRPDIPAWHPRAMLVATEIGRPLRRAVWAGSIAGAVVAIALATLLRPGGVLMAPVAAAGGAAAGLGVTLLVFPARVRRAFEAFAWLGRRELDRIRELTGSPFPTQPADAARWLEEFPRSRITAIPRVELLAVLGRFAEADAEAAAIGSPATDTEAVGIALNRQLLRIVAGRPRDDAELDALAARIDPASAAGRELRVGRASNEARGRLADGRRDWAEPLLEVRATLGSEPTRVLLRDVWWRLAMSIFGIGLAVSLAVILL